VGKCAKIGKQLGFEGRAFKKASIFGGSLLKGNAREKRPLDSKLPIHLVLRADVKGNLSMRHPRSYARVNRIIENAAKKYGVRLYQYANVGNHLHLLLRVPNLHLWGSFIREVTGRIAQQVQDLKGPQKGEKVWLFKPYTRVVHGWGAAFRSAKRYVLFNEWEGAGHISRRDYRSLRELELEWSDRSENSPIDRRGEGYV
jgi:putative transposase